MFVTVLSNPLNHVTSNLYFRVLRDQSKPMILSCGEGRIIQRVKCFPQELLLLLMMSETIMRTKICVNFCEQSRYTLQLNWQHFCRNVHQRFSYHAMQIMSVFYFPFNKKRRGGGLLRSFHRGSIHCHLIFSHITDVTVPPKTSATCLCEVTILLRMRVELRKAGETFYSNYCLVPNSLSYDATLCLPVHPTPSSILLNFPEAFSCSDVIFKLVSLTASSYCQPPLR